MTDGAARSSASFSSRARFVPRVRVPSSHDHPLSYDYGYTTYVFLSLSLSLSLPPSLSLYSLDIRFKETLSSAIPPYLRPPPL